MTRLSFEDSYRRLRDFGLADDEMYMPNCMPRYDDETLGVSFFKMNVTGPLDLSNLTLPRTFFGHSEIDDVSFHDSDLRESSLCWNDFVDVDFSSSDLRDSDVRMSSFVRVKFNGSNLDRTDLRGTSFTECSFENASMSKTIVRRERAESMVLSALQRSEIDWRDDDGEFPDGG